MDKIPPPHTHTRTHAQETWRDPEKYVSTIKETEIKTEVEMEGDGGKVEEKRAARRKERKNQVEATRDRGRD